MSQASSKAAVSSFPPSARAAAALVWRNPALGIVALIGCIDLAGNFWAGLGFDGFAPPVTGIAFLLAVSVLCSALRRLPVYRAIAELAAYLALWIGASLVGIICAYVAATASSPLADGMLAAFDTSLGFDWTAWVHAIRSWPVLNVLLRASYNSLLPQIVGSVLLFSMARIEGRNQELLCGAAIAMIIVCGCSALVPALGPWVHFGYGALRQTDTAYVPELLALRHSPPTLFAVGRMQGIVCFPSFHTVLAILFVNAHRGIRWSFPVIVVLNSAMLVSIPSEGGHYLADIVAGASVAALAIVVARALPRDGV